MEEFVKNFYPYDFAGHLVEDDEDEGENEIDFGTTDIIEENSNEDHKSENESDREKLKRNSDSIHEEISIIVINN